MIDMLVLTDMTATSAGMRKQLHKNNHLEDGQINKLKNHPNWENTGPSVFLQVAWR